MLQECHTAVTLLLSRGRRAAVGRAGRQVDEAFRRALIAGGRPAEAGRISPKFLLTSCDRIDIHSYAYC
jgi:hypothetical protein